MDRNLQSMRNELIKSLDQSPAADQICSATHDIGKDFRRSRFQDFLSRFHQYVHALTHGFAYIRIGDDNFSRQTSDQITAANRSFQGFLGHDGADGYFYFFGSLFADENFEFVAYIRNYIVIKLVTGNLDIF